MMITAAFKIIKSIISISLMILVIISLINFLGWQEKPAIKAVAEVAEKMQETAFFKQEEPSKNWLERRAERSAQQTKDLFTWIIDKGSDMIFHPISIILIALSVLKYFKLKPFE